MFDAIIVGARCGGSPTAMNLARAGHNVLVVDRDHFPSDTLSTHALTGDSVNRLRQWGLLDRVVEANGSGVYGPSQFNVAGQQIWVPGEGICPRRTILDKILVDAAREAGAEVREGCSVRALLRDDSGAITGIEYQSEGQTVSENARVVIGADGRNSFIAREVGAEVYNEKEAVACGYYSYYSGFPVSETQIHFADGVAAFAFPTSHGQTCLIVMKTADQFSEWRKDIEGGFRAAYEAVGLGEKFAKAERLEEFRGANEFPNYYRKPFGPGWTLVGDAGYRKDPVLGQGVNDAFRDADLLSGALDSVFKGEKEFEPAMSEYQQTRDAATAGIYQINHAFSMLQVTPELCQMLAGAAEARIKAAAGGQ